jgi:hypothetical protein
MSSGSDSDKSTTSITTTAPAKTAPTTTLPATTDSFKNIHVPITLDDQSFSLPLSYDSANTIFGIREYNYKYSTEDGFTWLYYTTNKGYDIHLRINGSSVPTDKGSLSFTAIATRDSRCKLCGFAPGAALSAVTAEFGSDYGTGRVNDETGYIRYIVKIYKLHEVVFFYDNNNVVTEIQCLSAD